MFSVYGETRGRNCRLGIHAMVDTIEEAREIVRRLKAKGERAEIRDTWAGEKKD